VSRRTPSPSISTRSRNEGSPTPAARAKREGESQSSSEVDVAGPDQLDRAVVELKPQRPVQLEAGEAPADRLVLGGVDREPRSRRMRPLLPGANEGRGLGRSPRLQQPGETGREQRREGFRRDRPAKRRRLPVLEWRRARQIDPEPHGDPIAAALEQDSGELPA